jgi:hypothetical protein
VQIKEESNGEVGVLEINMCIVKNGWMLCVCEWIMWMALTLAPTEAAPALYYSYSVLSLATQVRLT